MNAALFICRLLALLPASLAALAAVPTWAQSPSFAARFDELISTHNQGIVDLQRRRADRTEFQKLGDDRKEQVKLLLAEASATPVDDLPAEDLVALAQCCEILRHHHEALVYARAAHARAPDLPRVYLPLIQSLVNLQRHDEASDFLIGADTQCQHSPIVDSLHALLFYKYRARLKYEAAARHGRRAIGGWFKSIDESTERPHLLAQHLEAYVAVVYALQDIDELSTLRTRYASVSEEVTGSAINELPIAELDDDAFLHHCARHRVRCELARLLMTDSAPQAQREWLQYTWLRLQENTNNQHALVSTLGALQYVADHLHASDETVLLYVQQMSDDLKRLSDESVMSTATLRLHGMIQRTSGLLAQYVSLAKLLDKIPPEFNGLDVINSEVWRPLDTSVERLNEGHHGYTLLCFCNPWMPPGTKVSWRPQLGIQTGFSQQLRIRMFVPYSGYFWNNVTHKSERIPELTVEKEQESIRTVLKNQGTLIPCAMYKLDSAFASYYEVSPFPQLVLLDREGRICHVDVGVGDANLNRISFVLARDAYLSTDEGKTEGQSEQSRYQPECKSLQVSMAGLGLSDSFIAVKEHRQ